MIGLAKILHWWSVSFAFVFCCDSWEKQSSCGLLETLLLETASDPTGWGAQASKYAPQLQCLFQAASWHLFSAHHKGCRRQVKDEERAVGEGCRAPCPLWCATLQTLLLSHLLRLNPWPSGVLIEASSWRRYNPRPVEVKSISTHRLYGAHSYQIPVCKTPMGTRKSQSWH